MKIIRVLKFTAVFLLTFSVLLLPQMKPVSAGSTALSLIPPICFVREGYSSTGISPKKIISDKSVRIEIRFKLFDWICSLFG